MQDSSKLPPPVNLNIEPTESFKSNDRMRLPKSHRNLWTWVIVVSLALMVLVMAAFSWYSLSLRPVDEPSDAVERRIIVQSGDGVNQIAQTLKEADLIRSPLAFRIYSEASGLKSSLQAGGYVVNSAQSTTDIIKHMSEGITDEFDVTIIPGLTIDDIAKSLMESGFAARDVESALAASRDHPLLTNRPAGASLEGYIYPETYRLMADGQTEDVLIKALDEFKRIIDENQYESRLKAKGLTLYEGITLASIIQLEVPDPDDQKQVAQVFLKRLDEDMPLGSDPTFKYAAKKDGATPSINYDSPYNTRLYGGIPPGPIANFNISALEAVVNPAKGDFLYFVSGDDGRTHFSKTLEEHEALTERYCTDLCQ